MTNPENAQGCSATRPVKNGLACVIERNDARGVGGFKWHDNTTKVSCDKIIFCQKRG